MHLSNEFLEEVELLNLFKLESSLSGLKIHHEAAPERIAAAKKTVRKTYHFPGRRRLPDPSWNRGRRTCASAGDNVGTLINGPESTLAY
jgi:hypothetical protein